MLVEVSNTSFAVLRVNIAVGGLGDGDVLGRPVLRIDFLLNPRLSVCVPSGLRYLTRYLVSPLVVLYLVTLAIYYLLNNGRFTF